MTVAATRSSSLVAMSAAGGGGVVRLSALHRVLYKDVSNGQQGCTAPRTRAVTHALPHTTDGKGRLMVRGGAYATADTVVL